MTTFKEIAESLLKESGAKELLVELDQPAVERIAGEDGLTGYKLTSFRFKTDSGWITVQARGTRRWGEH
jgi:hypothetical protein